MDPNISWRKVTFTTGIILFILGTPDPLEGSVLIALGSILIATIAYLEKRRFRKLHIIAAIAICAGAAFMFYFSSLGGWGGSSTLSWWWLAIVVPYPIGWLINVICLIASALKRKTVPGETE
ncbi:MAG TPA: hypothetical protein VK907_03695 [Phnomibacter sp.]|nr:hypothetical protein [Phnomibacter sp.]